MKHIDVSDGMPSSYTIVFGSDVHAFVKGFAWKTAERTIQRINGRKHCFWTTHGDNIDYMSPQDSRFRLGLDDDESGDWRSKPLSDRADTQMLEFLKFFDKIGDRCVEVGIGNHEDRIINIINVARSIAKEWNCEWGTPMTIMNFGQFKAFLWHPFKFGMNLKAGDPQQRYANECVRIKRALRFKPGSMNCQVSILSHIHKRRISPPQCDHTLQISTDGETLNGFYPAPTTIKDPKTGQEYFHEDHRWFASTGALFGQYVEGDYTYAETRDYDPNELGWIEAVIKNDKFVKLQVLKL